MNEQTGLLHVKQQGDHILITSPFCDIIVDTDDGKVRVRLIDNGNSRVETQHVSWRDGRVLVKLEVMRDD